MDCWDKLHTCEKVIDKYYKKIRFSKNTNDEFKKLYSYIKQIAPEFYVDGKMHQAFQFIRYNIIRCEEVLPYKYIIDSKASFNFEDDKKIKVDSCNEEVVSYIVHEVRKSLVLDNGFRNIDINRMNLENMCDNASKKVKELCNNLNIECYTISIHPGYFEEANLLDGHGFHFFNIIKLENKYYLVDSTYSQFFLIKQNHLERIGIPNLAGCKPGCFMIMDEHRKKIAAKILKDGYIELNGDVFKNYLDGFTLSFRNGLYYEETQDFSFSTKYSKDDYIRFLDGEDNQINHEGKQSLGFQKRPLKNSQLVFEKSCK